MLIFFRIEVIELVDLGGLVIVEVCSVLFILDVSGLCINVWYNVLMFDIYDIVNVLYFVVYYMMVFLLSLVIVVKLSILI